MINKLPVQYFSTSISNHVDPYPFRKFLNTYFSYTEDNHGYDPRYSITGLTSKRTEKGFLITIITHLPGMLIGKQGRYIDTLQKKLTEFFDCEISIKIEESLLWSFKIETI